MGKRLQGANCAESFGISEAESFWVSANLASASKTILRPILSAGKGP